MIVVVIRGYDAYHERHFPYFQVLYDICWAFRIETAVTDRQHLMWKACSNWFTFLNVIVQTRVLLESVGQTAVNNLNETIQTLGQTNAHREHHYPIETNLGDVRIMHLHCTLMLQTDERLRKQIISLTNWSSTLKYVNRVFQ